MASEGLSADDLNAANLAAKIFKDRGFTTRIVKQIDGKYKVYVTDGQPLKQTRTYSRQENIYTTLDQAKKKAQELKQKGKHTKPKVTLGGKYELEELEENEFWDEDEAIAEIEANQYANILSQEKNMNVETKRMLDGRWVVRDVGKKATFDTKEEAERHATSQRTKGQNVKVKIDATGRYNVEEIREPNVYDTETEAQQRIKDIQKAGRHAKITKRADGKTIVEDEALNYLETAQKNIWDPNTKRSIVGEKGIEHTTHLILKDTAGALRQQRAINPNTLKKMVKDSVPSLGSKIGTGKTAFGTHMSEHPRIYQESGTAKIAVQPNTDALSKNISFNSENKGFADMFVKKENKDESEES